MCVLYVALETAPTVSLKACLMFLISEHRCGDRKQNKKRRIFEDSLEICSLKPEGTLKEQGYESRIARKWHG